MQAEHIAYSKNQAIVESFHDLSSSRIPIQTRKIDFFSVLSENVQTETPCFT